MSIAFSHSCRLFLEKIDKRVPITQNRMTRTLDFYPDTTAQQAVEEVSRYLGFQAEADKRLVSCLFPRRDEAADEDMFEFRTRYHPAIVDSVLKMGHVQENLEEVPDVDMSRGHKVWSFLSCNGHEVESELDFSKISQVYHRDRYITSFYNSATIDVFKYGVRGNYYRALQKIPE